MSHWKTSHLLIYATEVPIGVSPMLSSYRSCFWSETNYYFISFTFLEIRLHISANLTFLNDSRATRDIFIYLRALT